MSATRLLACHYWAAALLGLAAGVAVSGTAIAQKKYDPGASDAEIKIGNIMPYSGPASSYGAIGRTQAAYFRMINDSGGINGRKINFISYDDGYSPPKAIEQVRKLVENDGVLAVFSPLGTPSNTAMQKYLNVRQIPQLFVATGATKWNSPEDFPWTMGWLPSYQSEAQIYAKWLMAEKPGAKIAILYQNDDFGKDYVKGVREGLGAKGESMLMMEESYDVSEPTIDSHIVKIKAAHPDVLMIFATPTFAAQSIEKTADLGWKPLRILASVAASVNNVLRPAGIPNAQGVLSANYAKDPTDARWANDAGMQKFNVFTEKYMRGESQADGHVVYGYGVAQTLAKVLTMCGDDLTRANVMKQAASLKDFVPDTVLPGVKLNTSANDFAPIAQLQMMRFNGERWELFGEIISGDVTN